ncbi:MAG: hypothetical protein LLG04_03745 [Parachlamydia sp.]|nr:hypothetical protein [Parachlamydia sp.]
MLPIFNPISYLPIMPRLYGVANLCKGYLICQSEQDVIGYIEYYGKKIFDWPMTNSNASLSQPLDFCIHHSYPEALKKLVELEADIKRESLVAKACASMWQSGQAPDHPEQRPDLRVLCLLLSSGADPNAKDKQDDPS